jgi:hypothetical protein
MYFFLAVIQNLIQHLAVHSYTTLPAARWLGCLTTFCVLDDKVKSLAKISCGPHVERPSMNYPTAVKYVLVTLVTVWLPWQPTQGNN